MAVLGVQLVLSMVMASFLSKLSSHFSVGQWLLCDKLVRYLHPTEEELREMANIPKDTSKKSRRNDHKKKDESFSVPKKIEIQLECAKVRPVDVLQLHFYMEFHWLVDFAVCGIIIYVLTEVYYAVVQPKTEFNLSLMWCILAIGFCLKVLGSLTTMYFRTEEGGEKIMCIVFGFFFLLFAMGVLIVDEDKLEFGLEQGYANFSRGATEFLASQGIESTGPATLLTFKIILAIICAILGAFLTFPGLRLAKMYSDSMKYASGRPFMQLLLHGNMILPLLIVLMWVKPVMREYLVKRTYGRSHALMDEEMFETLRIVIIIAFCLFRFLLIWTHLQAHLNMAVEKVAELKKEAGRISSVELQRLVARVFYYLCVVALQYIAPVILLLYCAFLLKTLGNYSWGNAFGVKYDPVIAASAAQDSPANKTVVDSIQNTAAQFSLALATLREVFTPLLFKGLMSFLTWWISTALFTTTAFGMFYYGYFV